ncbi:methyl-accepting chemotaxis protein [Halomonas denitrificans]|uniref:methyl-accepting chemotaxis protein n=1 Tax=Halomonas denitrificans TaxID=370769 RepID=UPI000D358F12|nr:PAS domain-containing methyl-accepting chemotaxis protein [Halomonas denitrificans]
MLTTTRSTPLHRALTTHTPCIAFSPEGIILEASPSFLDTVGYRLDQIKGKHHRLFCPTAVQDDPAYRTFWAALARGQHQTGTFERLDAHGVPLWLEATYVPVKGARGRVAYIIKIASDVSRQRQAADDQQALLGALNASMAVIEFTPHGEILRANDNFLATMGYRLEEILGRHHRMFCSEAFYAEHPDFWAELADNVFKQGRYERFAAEGRPVWLEATYNPVTDGEGRVTRIVKFATDITPAIQAEAAARQTVESARASARQTETIAADGLTQLEEAVDSTRQADEEIRATQEIISALQEQVRTINGITDAISRIAQQTNLLALNAAVEAARAGEHGRGFAVVAKEVRELSQGSTRAADEITRVLNDNNARIGLANRKILDVVEHSRVNQQRVRATQDVIREIRAGAQSVSEAIREL